MAAGDPTGDDLCSGTTDGGTLPVGPTSEEREITFGVPVELTSGTAYAIIVRATSAGGGNEYVGWWRKTSNNYANGLGGYSSNSGSSWTQEPTTDFWFATKASGVEKDIHKENDISAPAFYGVIWRFQTFTASSTYTISSVVLKLYRGSDSPGTITVSIRATESVPLKATNPTPANAADDITLDQQTITWENGGGATSYNVYYGTESGNLSLLESGVTDTSYTVFGITNGSPFGYAITRYWRIDAVNAAGTTTGDEWSFTTITFNVPSPGPRGYSGEADGFAGGTIGDGQSNIKTRLVTFARNKVFYEDT